MKEMCRNFICGKNQNTQPADILPDTDMGDCTSCVKNRIGLAQAYIPSQPYTSPMAEEQSLVCGTVFSELVMPYCSGWNIHRFSKEV
ncbi:MAG: spore coat associated protein CotJA [Bacillota bacterium]|nr:spore coat associated protein CotJA [Bacillota bacterium]